MSIEQPDTNLPEDITQKSVFQTVDGAEHETLQAAIAHRRFMGVKALIAEYVGDKYAALGSDGSGSKGHTRDVNTLTAWEEWKTTHPTAWPEISPPAPENEDHE